MNPKRQAFGVSKIQRQKEGMLIHCHELTDEGFFNKDKPERELHPCDEFIVDLNKLKKFAANIIGYGSINRIVGDKKFKVTEDQSRYLMRLHQSLVDKIYISGIDMSMEDQVITSCAIKFSLTGYSSQNMEMKTYKIDLSGDIHGDEKDLTELCEKLIQHSYEYLFENKGGQGNLFKQGESESDEDYEARVRDDLDCEETEPEMHEQE